LACTAQVLSAAAMGCDGMSKSTGASLAVCGAGVCAMAG
jgi:hypothetical protein